MDDTDPIESIWMSVESGDGIIDEPHGLDSLDVVIIQSQLETHGVEVETDAISACATQAELVLLLRHLTGRAEL